MFSVSVSASSSFVLDGEFYFRDLVAFPSSNWSSGDGTYTKTMNGVSCYFPDHSSTSRLTSFVFTAFGSSYILSVNLGSKVNIYETGIGWIDSSYRSVVFTNASVSEGFYNWVYENADPVVSDVASDPVFTQNLPEGSGTVPYTVNYTVGQAAEPLTIVAESSDGGSLSYQWYQYGDVSSVVIEDATSSSYTPPTDTAGEVIYYCEVKNTISSGAAAVKNSNHVKVVVSASPVPTPDPDDPYPGIQDGIDNINNGIGNITDGIDNLGDQITELPGEIGDRVDQAADNLGNKLLDGIKGLFVPDEEDIADIKDKWEQLLSDRFGAVYESATIIDSIIDAFVYNGDMETISFPSATIDLAGTPFTFGGWEVEVIPERFRFLTTTSKLITSIVCTVLFVNGMKKKLEGLLSA